MFVIFPLPEFLCSRPRREIDLSSERRALELTNTPWRHSRRLDLFLARSLAFDQKRRHSEPISVSPVGPALSLATYWRNNFLLGSVAFYSLNALLYGGVYANTNAAYKTAWTLIETLSTHIPYLFAAPIQEHLCIYRSTALQMKLMQYTRKYEECAKDF